MATAYARSTASRVLSVNVNFSRHLVVDLDRDATRPFIS
jgi:hypothetical protein